MHQVICNQSSQKIQELVVDLRSDALTLPTTEMREVMFKASFGDDFVDCPTIIGITKSLKFDLSYISGVIL